ncbi:MAG: nitroreductase family protein [Candidatus Aureabacteria bacterium]|nr:nitroreductase family protein [Candidatus Auribacterota bacterium]
MLERIVFKNRSYRRFHEKEKISSNLLKDLINLARLTPSTANLQPLKYIISFESKTNALIFPCLRWAGYLKDWEGPEDGQRPSAYIVILNDKNICENTTIDQGIAAQSILLGAVEAELGGCIIASIDRDLLRKELKIDDQYQILLVLALGKPRERVMLENIKDGDVRYWRDKNAVHHVPKRPLDEILVDIG